ncbi:MAG: YopX family protein [Bacteroides sp.]|nr:YopX family protein [Bacteroides sp.]
MKREIKFRGRSLSGEWLYGDLVCRCGDVHVFPEDGVDSIDNYEVDPDTVGQYTGLKDKNGREIYEGDILNNYDEPNPLVVKWDEGGSRFGLFNLDDDCESDFTSVEVRLGLVVDAEVVGNIHDNPELLEGKELLLSLRKEVR